MLINNRVLSLERNDFHVYSQTKINGGSKNNSISRMSFLEACLATWKLFNIYLLYKVYFLLNEYYSYTWKKIFSLFGGIQQLFGCPLK